MSTANYSTKISASPTFDIVMCNNKMCEYLVFFKSFVGNPLVQ